MMNFARILRVSSCYLFFTGYQISWCDRKSLHYGVTVSGILYHAILFVLYFMCFCHHFESSSTMSLLLDVSPFLNSLVHLQVLIGLKSYVFCVIETKNLTKIFNGLLNIFTESVNRLHACHMSEICAYLLFFATPLAAITIALYIAIECKFHLPNLDQIMIGTALFLPHLALAGCLRCYTLGLWLIKRTLVFNGAHIQCQDSGAHSRQSDNSCVIEIFNIASSTNATEICEKFSKSLDNIADYLKVFDRCLQRQLSVLVVMNFNCLLASAYMHVYFENMWKILFSNRNCRIFYAANYGIIICILLDYGILLFTHSSFCRAKQNLFNVIASQHAESGIKNILQNIKRKLSHEFKLKLFGLVEFSAWNFLILQGLMVSIIALIVSHQYLNDQIRGLNERLDVDGDSK